MRRNCVDGEEEEKNDRKKNVARLKIAVCKKMGDKSQIRPMTGIRVEWPDWAMCWIGVASLEDGKYICKVSREIF